MLHSKGLKRVLLVLAVLLALVVLAVGVYVAYIVLAYYRIPDDKALVMEGQASGVLQPGASYTAMTHNIGFGAYDHAFSFFMDTGTMDDGSPVKGQHARAQSQEIALSNTEGALALAQAEQPDFLLLQEVDEKADRSFQLNQVQSFTGAFPAYVSVYASNFHTPFLAYPFHEPIGATESGLLTLSRYPVASAQRRSYPVDENFPTKFFDLDRCFAVLRLPVEGGGELVLINSHMSAYDEGGKVREAQMEMLCGLLETERQAVLDGFIVSDNLRAEAQNLDTDFQFSDHNPVLLRFTLES